MERLELFTVTVPAGTTQAAPAFTAIPMDIGGVERIEIVIPPGPSGLAGFGIMHGGASVFPREENRWVISDNEKIGWDIVDAPTAGDWTIRGFNVDVFDHSFYFRFLVGELTRTTPREDKPLTVEQPNQPAPVDESESMPGAGYEELT